MHPCCDFDNEAFARIMVREMVARGRCRLALVAPPRGQSDALATWYRASGMKRFGPAWRRWSGRLVVHEDVTLAGDLLARAVLAAIDRRSPQADSRFLDVPEGIG